MSADTTLAIVSKGGVWYCKMIQNAEEFDSSWVDKTWEKFDTKSAVVDRAIEICQRNYAEYGICFLGKFK